MVSGSSGAAAGGSALEEFDAPDEDTVARVLLRLGDPQHRRVFYSGLDNPKWVTPLAAQGAFERVAPAGVDAGGVVRAEPWPEGEYLARMAQTVPSDVADVLEPIADTENVYAQQAITSAALAMPAPAAARLVPAIVGYIEQSTAEWLDPLDLSRLAIRLLEGDAHTAALSLLEAMYKPHRSGDSQGPLGPRALITAGLTDYWFAHTLPGVAEALVRTRGVGGLHALVNWLEQWQTISGQFDSSTGRDASIAWRPSIAEHEQNMRYEELGDALTDAVRDATRLLQVLGGTEEALRPLKSSPQPLVRRIALECVAERLASVGPEEDMAALDMGRQYLLDPLLLDMDYRVEYSRLARAVLPHASHNEIAQWRAAIEAGPALDDGQISRVLRSFAEEEGSVDERAVEAFRERWRRDLLASVGKSHLPQSLREWLDELERVHGPPAEHAEFPTWSESFVGPISPLEGEELAKRTVDDVLAYLQNWTPPDSPFGPTKEGLGRQLATRVANEPEPVAERAPDFAAVDPTYARAVIDGLERGLSEGRRFSWSPVVELLRVVVSQPDDLTEESVDFDADTTWRWSKKAAASLLAAGLKSATMKPPAALGHNLLGVLAVLASDRNPTPEHEERFGGENMDPLTLSLNTVRPVAIRALVRFLEWNQNQSTPDPELHTQGLELLAMHVGTSADESLAVQAVFGESLGILVALDEPWLNERLTELLGDPDQPLSEEETPGPDVVWSTMLVTYRPSPMLLDKFQPYFTQRILALDVARKETVGWKTTRTPRQQLGDHLVILYIQGALNEDENRQDLVGLFFDNANAQLRSDVLGHLGWLLGRAGDEIPGETIRRAASLWDHRAQAVAVGDADPIELSGFSWWVRSGRFDIEWWLPRLLQAARGTTLESEFGIGEALASAAKGGFPGPALEALTLLMSEGDPWRNYDLVRNAPAVIAAALTVEDAAVTTAADALLDRLGREGYTDLARLVGLELQEFSTTEG
jgi:hypothetical protein